MKDSAETKIFLTLCLHYSDITHTARTGTEAKVCSFFFFFLKMSRLLYLFQDTHTQTTRNDKKKGKKRKKVGCRCLLSWLFCFVVDPVAWVCIHGQFLRALPVRAGMCARSPTPIGSIVHSTWLSLTHTASCLRGSHEPVLPPRKETFVTHRPVSHHYTVQTKKSKFVLKKKKCIYTPKSPASRQRGIHRRRKKKIRHLNVTFLSLRS